MFDPVWPTQKEETAPFFFSIHRRTQYSDRASILGWDTCVHSNCKKNPSLDHSTLDPILRGKKYQLIECVDVLVGFSFSFETALSISNDRKNHSYDSSNEIELIFVPSKILGRGQSGLHCLEVGNETMRDYCLSRYRSHHELGVFWFRCSQRVIVALSSAWRGWRRVI